MSSSNHQWKMLPYCPNNWCTIVSVDNILTTVGRVSLSPSNELYSFIDDQWVECFPPMPTGRWNPAAVFANNTLIVAGGGNASHLLTTVEILNTVNRQWSSVISLPMEMRVPSITICGDYVYIHPHTTNQEKNSIYKCLLKQLVQYRTEATWEKMTSLPVSYSSLVTINDHVLAVGGEEAHNHATINIYQYIDTLWTVIGHMKSPRSAPATTVLPGNKLMVVGGFCAEKKCEIATLT